MSRFGNGSTTPVMAESLLNSARATPEDAELLSKIANNSVTEAECISGILRLMMRCADLRRRLEGAEK